MPLNWVQPKLTINTMRCIVESLLHLQLQGGVTEMYVNVTGLTSNVVDAATGSRNRKYALHVHSYGDLSRGCASTGDHYNPFGTLHGGPRDHPAMR